MDITTNMKIHIVTRAETEALGQYLSDYPENKSYDEVIDMIHEEHPDIIYWKPFEHKRPSSIANLIEGFKSNRISQYKRLLETLPKD